MKLALRSVVFSSLVAAGLTVASGALAFTAAPAPAAPSLVEKTAGGCGPGMHPDVYGQCVPNLYGGYGVGVPGYYGGVYRGGAYGYHGGAVYRGGGVYRGGVHGGAVYRGGGAYRGGAVHGGAAYRGGARRR